MAVGVCVLMFAAVVWVRAAEPGDKKPMGSRLTQPWSKISSLSDEQKSQIREIHSKALAEKKAIDEKERADIMALLNDEQKSEAQKLIDEQKKTKPPVGTEVRGDPSNEKKVEEKKATE
jgi:Spy/CpxP family protein refolding chaperone